MVQSKEIISNLDKSDCSLLHPRILDELENFSDLIQISTEKNLISYILLPSDYNSLNLKNVQTEGFDRKDSAFLTLLELIRELVVKNSIPVVVFDRLYFLSRFQYFSTKLEKDCLPICLVGKKEIFIRFLRHDSGPQKYWCDKERQYPKGCLKIRLFIANDEFKLTENEKVIVYFKTEKQVYESGYPKIKNSEYQFYEKQETTSKKTIIVLVSDITCIPRPRINCDSIYLSVGKYTEEKLVFEAVAENKYSEFLSELNSDCCKILSKITTLRGRFYFSEYFVKIVYNLEDTATVPLEEARLFRMTENRTLQIDIGDFFNKMENILKKCHKLSPKISGWKDIQQIKDSLKKNPKTIQYFKELEPSLIEIFRILFGDVIAFNKLFKLYQQNMHCDEFQAQTKKVIKELLGSPLFDSEADDFDPETAVGYISAAQGNTFGTGTVQVQRFSLGTNGEKYILYCSPNSKFANKKIGDIIEKKYWNYYTLKKRIIQYLNETETEDNNLFNSIKLADQFHNDLEIFVFDSSSKDYKNLFPDEDIIRIRTIFRNWANDTMQPRKKNYKLLKQVTTEINQRLGKEFDPREVYTCMGKIKSMRKFFKIGAEIQKIRYKILEGPITTIVEAEKVGRIYRIS